MKILKRIAIALILLLVLTYAALHLPSVQTWIVKQVASVFSKELKTKVTIQHVDVAFFDKLEIKGVLVEDRQKDTLLYAGTATINITDWFFFKDKAVLKYIGLKDAVVNMKRTDTVWNYSFLIDYFSSPKKEKSTTKKGGLEFDIKRMELENIRFNQIDEWLGQNMSVALKNLNVTAEESDFTKKKINLSSLELNEPIFSQSDYMGNREKLHIPKPVRDRSKDLIPQYKWNNDEWVIDIKNIHLTNGVFGNEKETIDKTLTAGYFDGKHILFSKITGDLKNVHFEKDTLTTDLNLSTKERSGFEVKKLQAAFKFTPEMMEFDKLDLVTNKSRLGNYYAMRYQTFSDMSSFLHKVTIESNFEKSKINSDDIAFFAPALKTWNRNFDISGIAKGTIDNFTAKKMLIKSGNTNIDGDITMSGLPDISNTFIDFSSRNLETNYNDLVSIIPALKKVTQPQLNKLGNIQYKGNFTGFVNDFVAFGTINTDLGNITGDLNLKLPENMPEVYSGTVSTTGFQLGNFIGNSQIGNIAFDGKVKGSGFSTDNVKANLDGRVSSFGFGGYTYQNISLKGDFGKQIFTGSASIDDPNLKLENLHGTIDLSKKTPQLAFDVNVSKANLKELHFTKDSFEVAGHFDMNFTGSNIDNFLGKASILNATLTHNGQRLSFDSLVLRSEIFDNQKQLTLESNEADAKVTGNFTILELPNAFQLFLNNYYPAYIPKPKAVVKNQDFTFTIHTKNIDEYVKLLDAKLQGFNYATLDGSLKLQENALNINANVPQFSYDGKSFNNIRLEGIGNLDTLVTKIDVDDVTLGDSLHLPTTHLVITSHNDISDISLNTSASKTLSDASLHAKVQTLTNGVDIHFFPSTFILNDKQWEIEKDGSLLITNSQISANNLKLTQGHQQIIMNTDIDNFNSTKVELYSVNIDDITPFLFKDPHLEGQITGNIYVTNPFGKPLIEYDIVADNFKFENDSIGLVTAIGNFSTKTGIVTFDAGSNNDNYKFNVAGSYNINDSVTNQADINFKTDKFNLAILNNYLDGIFSNIEGYANTNDLKVSGNSKNLSLSGTATLNDASLVVKYTQCKYFIAKKDIIFNPGEINFDKLTLKDTLNNIATLRGKIYHKFFKDFEFDNLNFSVNKPGDAIAGTNKFLVLNTQKKDNPQFYGKVIGDANTMMNLNGPVTNMVMTIKGGPTVGSARDSSHIFLNTGTNSIENGKIDYIDFIQFGTEMSNNLRAKEGTNIFVDMTLRANPTCKIDVILDETTGDIIKGKGNGELNIQVGSREPLSIRGRYNITEGDYTFNFQALVKKPFKLSNGSISWEGDPYRANIDMSAVYTAEKVDFSGIIADNTRQRKEDVTVVANLTGNLLQPKITFELIPTGALKEDLIVSKRLAEFKTNENEMNKQVTSLLLFNSFITDEQTFLNANSGLNVATNSIGNMVSNMLANSLNNLLRSLNLADKAAFNIDLNSNTDLQSSIAKLQIATKLGVRLNFFDNRLIVNIGGNFDYNNPYVLASRNTNLLITPDVAIEWLLSEDGRVRLVGFNQTNPDVVGQRNKTGIKLSYRKEVDKLSLYEIFRKPGKARKK
ncbi:translocation/assembly module TamB domain-containing protein [Ferruginibacter sp. SUN002]|uniref:translocation/assembly module TamB domain-containing protein n=1 Tax=Ferruginibacter sp. SUN002 TaxID=2937789 RepID=UPI003D369B3E